MTKLTPLPAGLLTVEHRPGIAYSGAMRRYEPIQSLPDGEHKLYTQATLQREQDKVLRLEGEVARLRINSARYLWLRRNPQWMGWDHNFQPDEVEREIDNAMKETP